MKIKRINEPFDKHLGDDCMEELATCELCFWNNVDLDVQCEKCGRYFCEDCGSYGECVCNGCKEKR